MPRIYADVNSHTMDWGAVDFVNGVAAVPYGSNTAYWTAESYAIDANRDTVSVFDGLTQAQTEAACAAMGVSYTPGVSTKQAMVRAIETMISTAKITALTVASSAGTAIGDSNIDVTGSIGTEGNLLYYKTGTAALTPLYMDQVNTGWTVFVTNADITPAASHTKINVAETNAAGSILSFGSATITKRTT